MRNKDLNPAFMSIPNTWAKKEILRNLNQGRKILLPIKGRSMEPFIRERDRVVLAPFNKSALFKGSIVLATYRDNMLLHRVVRMDGGKICLAGDGNMAQHEYIEEQDIAAVIVRLCRGRRTKKLNTYYMRTMGLIWYRFRPLRKLIAQLFKLTS